MKKTFNYLLLLVLFGSLASCEINGINVPKEEEQKVYESYEYTREIIHNDLENLQTIGINKGFFSVTWLMFTHDLEEESLMDWNSVISKKEIEDEINGLIDTYAIGRIDAKQFYISATERNYYVNGDHIRSARIDGISRFYTNYIICALLLFVFIEILLLGAFKSLGWIGVVLSLAIDVFLEYLLEAPLFRYVTEGIEEEFVGSLFFDLSRNINFLLQ